MDYKKVIDRMARIGAKDTKKLFSLNNLTGKNVLNARNAVKQSVADGQYNINMFNKMKDYAIRSERNGKILSPDFDRKLTVMGDKARMSQSLININNNEYRKALNDMGRAYKRIGMAGLGGAVAANVPRGTLNNQKQNVPRGTNTVN